MRSKLIPFGAVTLLFAGFMLGACDEAEQGRVLRYEKGTYLGKADRPLSAQDKDELRQRTRLQQGG
jgi:hypothetical protein